MQTPYDYSSPLERQLHHLTVTDARRYREIVEFKGAEGRRLSASDFTFDRLVSIVGETRLANTLDNLVEVALLYLNEEIAQAIPREEIVERFRARGLRVDSVEELCDLDIDDVEPEVRHVRRKYVAFAVSEGVVTGFAGLPGALVDLPALLGVGLRAVAETATYYGFDAERGFERNFAVLILAMASAPIATSRMDLLDTLEEVVRSCQEKPSEPLSGPLMDQVAQALVIRLVRGKLGQAIPVVGALFGGGYNRRFISRVCEAARRLYQERWLLARYATTTREIA